MSGRLVVCPTPIGNLEDVTLRVLRTLEQADTIACEDTRHTRRLLSRHGIPAGRRLVSCHEHNERRRAGEIAARVREGEVVALVSDAGTPGVSDPGALVIEACIEAGTAVEVLPGPSALVTALVASGLGGGSWRFAGFLPRKRADRARALAPSTETLVCLESPARLAATLALLAEADPERPVAVCRELTKVHEEVVRGTAGEVARRFAAGTRGEVVLVIGPSPSGPGAAAPDELDVVAALAAVERLTGAGARRRVAASVVSSLTGIPANDIYRAGVARDPGGA